VAVDDSEEVVILELKLVQSAVERSPRTEAEAEGKLNVIVFVLVEMEKLVPVVEEAKMKVFVVTPLMVEVTWGWVLVIVLPILERPLEKVRALSLELKTDQSAEDRSPRAEAEAEGKLKVWVDPEEEIKKSVPDVEEAKICSAEIKPFKEVMPEPEVPASSSAQTIVPVAVAVRTPPFASEEQLRPEKTNEPPGASTRLFEPAVAICGLVPPKIRLPLERTGIWLPLADWDGVNPPTVEAFTANPLERTRWRGARFSKEAPEQEPPTRAPTSTFRYTASLVWKS
jgi:hypothetical protein